MKVTQIMSRNVESISGTANLVEAAQWMGRDDIGFLAVMAGDQITGVLTDRDIVIRAVAEGLDCSQTPVRDVMTSQVYLISDEDTVERAGLLMQEKRVRRVLVQGSDGRCVGVVSLGDLAAAGHQCELSGKTLEQVCT